MPLTRVERERINDSRLKIQSAANSLTEVNPSKIPDWEEIQRCLKSADRNLSHVLNSADSQEAFL